MSAMIPYGRQDITAEDIDAVINVLKSDFLTQGPVVPAFEQAIAQKVGAKHALAVNSATSALHLACLALNLGAGDYLWTSPNTFVASANCGLYCGASIDFVDIDPRTFNICPIALEKKLLVAQQQKRLPKVVVAVHMCGQPCEMLAIATLAKRFGFKIIEDASHAIGAKYQGNPIGNSKYSDITVFSFHPVKIITTAEGGMILTNQTALAAKMELLRSHGITRNEQLMTAPSQGPWYYEQLELGYNYRMTELQAALGLSQSDRLEKYVERRQKLAERYDILLSELPVVAPWQHPDTSSARHLYIIRLDTQSVNISHKECFEQLREQGIGINLHYIPVHLQPYYKRFGFKRGDFPQAEQYYKEAISLPLYPGLTEAKQDQVVSTLKKILTQ
jgi:UDP-4-amino-4,6-dideoxy-N-acetyl-beta-L-altrosamine transaminase